MISECDVAVIGASLGGVAAALAAAEAGCQTILVSPEMWIGGQITSQGVAPLDEHPLIEQFGGTGRYMELRQRIRAIYHEQDRAPFLMANGRPLNPGRGWVSHLCFEPQVGHQALLAMLVSAIANGTLHLLTGYKLINARHENGHIRSVTVGNGDKQPVELRAAYFLDATDLGDLLPLAEAPHVTGAESQDKTGEPHASRDGEHPERVQSFTYTFLVEHHAGRDFTISRPPDYEVNRDHQPFSLSLTQPDGSSRRFGMFSPTADSDLPFWTYRRVVDAQLLNRPRDIAVINWHGNDYAGGNIIGASPDQRDAYLQAAKNLALGFLYYLQTEVPRDDGRGFGYPGLQLLTNGLGTVDGLSQAPYIRESRRIIGRHQIVEQEIAAATNSTARAAHFADSVGVGWYSLDLHPAVGCEESFYLPTRPFQIPLGALISPTMNNLLPACKNIATTHLTNGAYRVHPVEWNVGETAGMLAAFCVQNQITPQTVLERAYARTQFQTMLLQAGIPLMWLVDIPPDHPHFLTAQSWLLHAPPGEDGDLKDRLELGLDHPLDRRDFRALFHPFLGEENHLPAEAGTITADEANEDLEARSFSANLTGDGITPRQLLERCGPAVLSRLQQLP